MKSNKHAGQFKLRGKKSALLSCKCCTVENWKEDCRKKEAEKEIYDAKLGENPQLEREQAIAYMDLRRELYG